MPFEYKNEAIPISLPRHPPKEGLTWVEVVDGKIMVTWGSLHSAMCGELSVANARRFAEQLHDAARTVSGESRREDLDDTETPWISNGKEADHA